MIIYVVFILSYLLCKIIPKYSRNCYSALFNKNLMKNHFNLNENIYNINLNNLNFMLEINFFYKSMLVEYDNLSWF